MKRFLCCLLAIMLMTVFAVAEDIDLSGLTFDELAALRDRIQLEMMTRDEWQEVTVPQGLWEVGKDIPAGTWNIKVATNKRSRVYCGITICDKLNSTHTEAVRSGKVYVYQQLAHPDYDYNAPESINVTLPEGVFIIIENSDTIFSPYHGAPTLGFK